MEFQGYLPNETDLKAAGTRQTALHDDAVEATRARFGRNVFVRAVVEISNFCRENCAYCGMRRDNRALHRYRARYEQIAEMLIHHRPASVTDVNIQSGEDPVVVREVVLPLLETLRRETSLGISLCLGTLTPQIYDVLQEAGAALYIMKFEAGDAARYAAASSARHFGRAAAPHPHVGRARMVCQLRSDCRFARTNIARSGGRLGAWLARSRFMDAVSALLFRAMIPPWPTLRPPIRAGPSMALPRCA